MCFVILLTFLGDLKVFEDDPLMAHKPREGFVVT